MVLSAYLLISWHANNFQNHLQNQAYQPSANSTSSSFEHHIHWEAGTTWKSALNNLRLIIQPFIFWCLLEPWLHIFPIPGLKRGFFKLMTYMNNFRAFPMTHAQIA